MRRFTSLTDSTPVGHQTTPCMTTIVCISLSHPNIATFPTGVGYQTNSGMVRVDEKRDYPGEDFHGDDNRFEFGCGDRFRGLYCNRCCTFVCR